MSEPDPLRGLIAHAIARAECDETVPCNFCLALGERSAAVVLPLVEAAVLDAEATAKVRDLQREAATPQPEAQA